MTYRDGCDACGTCQTCARTACPEADTGRICTCGLLVCVDCDCPDDCQETA